MRRRIIGLFIILIFVIIFIVGYLLGNKSFSNIEGILNSIVALAGLFVALLTVLLTYTTRIDLQRQSLYEKQLEKFEEIYPKILEYSQEIVRMIHKDKPSTIEIKRVDQIVEEVDILFRKYWIIMPSGIILLFIRINSEFTELKKFIISENKDKVKIRILMMHHSNSISMMFNSFRSSMGIDKLHEDTINIIGTKSDYKKDHSLFESVESRK
jgi:hypothetical protein